MTSNGKRQAPVKVLIIEDSDDDAILICEELRRGGFQAKFERVETPESLKQALSQERGYEVIVSDYSLPQFNALDALKIVRDSGRDIPVIVVSGSVREAAIVDVMRAGARDYVMKENLTRLPLAVERELEEAEERRRRRDIEVQLRHSQRLESLGVLAGGVAHDFNNLLTGIIGNVSLAIEDTAAATPLRPMLEQALQAAQQAANLTRQMLAYAGKGGFIIEPVDVAAAVHQVGALLSASVTKNVSLLLDLGDGLPRVQADKGQVQQLVMNLVINAAEAIGPEQPGTVFVSAGTQNVTEEELRNTVVRDGLQPGRYVCIEVRDTGVGMDAATQARIFDPFFTTKFTGRGLGLSAVLGIVRSHHGTIRVSSEPGKGSVFTVFLPATSEPPQVEPPAKTAQASRSNAVVLVIDDEETIRRTAKAILERRGMHVFAADTGRAGVDLFRRLSDRVSVVLLDLTMPAMSGAEALREIHAIRREVPVILSSGYNESDAMNRVEPREVAAFIQKPYTAEELLAQVLKALGD